MDSLIQVFVFVVLGVFLLWFGYTLFFGPGDSGAGAYASRDRGSKPRRIPPRGEGYPGAPQTCPVCSARLERGERVKSSAFPSMGNGERLMHISGCVYCLEGDRERSCPVCGVVLYDNEFLIARMFEKPGRSHVHVLGCTHCRGPASRRH